MELFLAPTGNLGDRENPEHRAGAVLLGLLCGTSSPGESAAVCFFRRFVREFAARLRRAPESAVLPLAQLLPSIRPSPEEFSDFALSAPPFPGASFLTTAAAQELYRELEQAVLLEGGGKTAADYLHEKLPAWDQVGKVGFHLTEHPTDATGATPFLFLATFVHRLDGNNQPKHLPLGRALKMFQTVPGTLLTVLEPLRRAAEQSTFVARYWQDRQLFAPLPLRAQDAHLLLTEAPLLEDAGIGLRIVNLWKKRPRRLQVQVDLGLPAGESKLGAGAMLRFSARAALGEEEISAEELKKLAENPAGLLRFKGEWIEADPQKINELLSRWRRAEAMQFHCAIPLLQGLRLLAGAPAPARGGVPPLDENTRFAAAGTLREYWEGSVAEAMPPLPENLDSLLRSYQREGVSFLWRMSARGLGACLADDMGLGKTLQLLAVLELLRREGTLAPLPALLIIPASLLENWRAEAAKFTPELRVGLLHRAWTSPEEWNALQQAPETFLKRFDLVAVTYATLLRLPALTGREYPLIALDEAQAIKNPASRQSRAVRALCGRRRIALTGTPLENNLSDLWSLFDFLEPGLLGTPAEFAALAVQRENGDLDYTPLRRLIRPFLLRRVKTDRALLPELPDKVERVCYCRLTREQTSLYLQLTERLKAALNEPDAFKRKGIILGSLAHFKQVCNHPAHYRGDGDYRRHASGKFERLLELAGEMAENQDKLLLFTQFREMTGPLHELLTEAFGRPGLILHGGTPVPERARHVAAFQSENGPPFFILSLKAGGTGLNLTAANQVIHFDRWWNPAVENQATDRAYRIGQHRNIQVHKFVTCGTIEQKIARMLEEKKDLSDALLSSGVEKLLTDMNNAELLAFLKLDSQYAEEE